MKKSVIVVFILSLLILSSFSVLALEREKYYKGKTDMLLRKGDRLMFDDLKLRVRDVDHFYKTATFDFSLGKARLDRAVLGLDEEYNFQDKLNIKVIDVYRKLWYKDKRVYFVRIEVETFSSGRISRIDLEGKFSKSPYVLIENTGSTRETFFIKTTTARKSYSITPEKQYVILDPFESEKINLRVEENAPYLKDWAIITLRKDGLVVDKKIAFI